MNIVQKSRIIFAIFGVLLILYYGLPKWWGMMSKNLLSNWELAGLITMFAALAFLAIIAYDYFIAFFISAIIWVLTMLTAAKMAILIATGLPGNESILRYGITISMSFLIALCIEWYHDK